MEKNLSETTPRGPTGRERWVHHVVRIETGTTDVPGFLCLALECSFVTDDLSVAISHVVANQWDWFPYPR